MKTEYIILKETQISSNCPECYATDGLILSFKQQKVYSRFMSKSKNQVIERMHCTKCETDIFPGRYTDDIQRVYDYHKKTIALQPSTIHLSTTSYILMTFIFLIICAIGTYIIYPEVFESI